VEGVVWKQHSCKCDVAADAYVIRSAKEHAYVCEEKAVDLKHGRRTGLSGRMEEKKYSGSRENVKSSLSVP
jgi:hypothetical protein